MPFGIMSAQEIFQMRMNQLLGNLSGVETNFDDTVSLSGAQDNNNMTDG